jgi:hypothetical protein
MQEVPRPKNIDMTAGVAGKNACATQVDSQGAAVALECVVQKRDTSAARRSNSRRFPFKKKSAWYRIA